MRTTAFAFTLILLLLVPAYAQKGKNKGKPAATDNAKIVAAKQALAVELASFAEWCLKNKFPETAKSSADEAAKLDAENKKAAEVSGKAGGSDSTEEAALKSLAKKRESAGKKIGPMYCELFLEGPATARAEYDAYIEAAFAWDADNTDKWVEANYKKPHAEKNYALVVAMLTAARAHEKEGSKLAKAYPERAKVLRECEARLASQNPLLKKARNHTMRYFLSLPSNWTPESKWPVIVAVEGAGCNYDGMNRGYGGPKNAHWIVVTPCGFTNTNALDEAKYPYYSKELLEEWNGQRMGFDEPGLLAALEDVRADWNAEEKIYITGFSGGGNLTYFFTFKHPEKLMASAPASANFAMHPPDQFSDHECRATLPVHVFQGEDDPYRKPDSISPLDRQWENAKATLESRQYKNYKYTLVPKTGHSACRDQVVKFFDEVRIAHAQAAPDGKKK